MAKVKKKLHLLKDASYTSLENLNSAPESQDTCSPSESKNEDVNSLRLSHVDSLLNELSAKPLQKGTRQNKTPNSAKRIVVKRRPRKRAHSMPAQDFANEVSDSNVATAVCAPKRRKEVPKGSDSPSIDELCHPDGNLLGSKEHSFQSEKEANLNSSGNKCDVMNLSVDRNDTACDHRTFSDTGSVTDRLHSNQRSGESSPTVDDIGASFSYEVCEKEVLNHTSTPKATDDRKASRARKRKKSVESVLTSPRSPTPPGNQESNTPGINSGNKKTGPANLARNLSSQTACVVQSAKRGERRKSQKGSSPRVNSAARRSRKASSSSPCVNAATTNEERTQHESQVSSIENNGSCSGMEPDEVLPAPGPVDAAVSATDPGPSCASSPPTDLLQKDVESLSPNPSASDTASCYKCDTCPFQTNDNNLMLEHKNNAHSAQVHRQQDQGLYTSSEGSLDTERPLDPESGSDQDDDEELPEAFPETDTKPLEKVSVGDIMWVKTKKYPFWPAVVKNVYYVKKKLSKVTIVFIGVYQKGIKGLNGKPRGLTMNYKKEKVIPFGQSHLDHEKLKTDGMASKWSSFFEECLNRVEDYLYKKATGETSLGTLEYFKEEMALDELQGVEMTPNLLESIYSPPQETDNEKNEASDSGEESDVMHNVYDSPKMSKALVKKLQKSREAGQKIIDIISQPQTKELMFKIYRGEKDSCRHKQYLDPALSITERNSLKMAGYGRITDDAQRDAIMDILVRYWRVMLPKKKMVDIDYITSVWVPEAIIYAMTKTLRCGYKRAEEKYVQGPRFTKEELKRFEREIMANKDSIDKEARERYDRKIDRNVRKLQSLEANFRGPSEPCS